MKTRRFTPNAWLGLLDLVFLLCMLFFLTTVISVRQVALAEDVADDETQGDRSAVVVRLVRAPTKRGPVEVALVSAGGRRPPEAKTPVLSWLAAMCAKKPTPVEVACPPEATHIACKRGVLGIRKAARSCRFRY